VIESDSDIGGGEGLEGGAPDGAMPSLRELLTFLARSLVEFPDKVEISEIVEPDALVFEIRVAESDLGRIIGRQGRTAKALRTVMAAASAKQKRRVIVDIIE
jgi:uncharacterized protein